LDKGLLTAIVTKKYGDETIRLPLTIAFHELGTARVTIDEERRQKGDIELRHNSKAKKQRYNEAEKWAIVGGTTLSKGAAASKSAEKGVTKVAYGPGSAFEA
ncbi:glucosidase II, partial [Teratosphaeriaceae sp. CCFEE 6253]